MIDLADIFAELGISHYLNDFVEQGFDTWDTILDITESDFDALGVKLGHRRKLQRKIAETRGLSSDRALASPSRNTPSDDRQSDEKRVSGTKTDAKDASSGTNGAKRKYRRHPKPDENAPERPPSAYVIFSNKMREDFKGRNLSFTEIAKLVGENWQSLSPGEKEPYEQQAFSAKERYNNELAEYKKTSEYTEYSKYLAEFKTRQSNQQQGISNCMQGSFECMLTKLYSDRSRCCQTTQTRESCKYGKQWNHKQRCESTRTGYSQQSHACGVDFIEPKSLDHAQWSYITSVRIDSLKRKQRSWFTNLLFFNCPPWLSRLDIRWQRTGGVEGRAP